jgi:hypothetical protein
MDLLQFLDGEDKAERFPDYSQSPTMRNLAHLLERKCPPRACRSDNRIFEASHRMVISVTARQRSRCYGAVNCTQGNETPAPISRRRLPTCSL